MMEVRSRFASVTWLGGGFPPKCIPWKRTWTMILLRQKWRNRTNKTPRKKIIGKMKNSKRKTSKKVSKGKLVIRNKEWSDFALQKPAQSANQPLYTLSLPVEEDDALSLSSMTLSQSKQKKAFRAKKNLRGCKGTHKVLKNKLHHLTADLVRETLQNEDLVKQATIPEIKNQQLVDLPFIDQGHDGKWLDYLDLDYEHRFILQSQQWLDDKIIDAAQTLLKNQFNPDGLQTCLMSHFQFEPVCGRAAQIHYDSNRHHWFTSCFRGNRVEVADSLTPFILSLSARKQIKECYGSVIINPLSTVQMLKVDQQPNSNDCGVYAIANAFELLSNGDPTCRYRQEKMREHLISCFEKGYITAFPKCP